MIPKTVLVSILSLLVINSVDYCSCGGAEVKAAFMEELTPAMKANMVKTDNGCPLPYDFGQLGGAWYLPHDLCFNRRFPPYVNPDEKPANTTGEVEFQLELFPGTTDTYKLTIRVVDPKSTKFRIWDAVIWNTAGDDATSVAAGYFEVKEYFLPVCCDFKGGPQIRDTMRFTNINNERLREIFVRWVPLDFKGVVRFYANIFSTPNDYIKMAKSPKYNIPFPLPKDEEMAYDEDWPEDSPYIEQY